MKSINETLRYVSIIILVVFVAAVLCGATSVGVIYAVIPISVAILLVLAGLLLTSRKRLN